MASLTIIQRQIVYDQLWGLLHTAAKQVRLQESKNEAGDKLPASFLIRASSQVMVE